MDTLPLAKIATESKRKNVGDAIHRSLLNSDRIAHQNAEGQTVLRRSRIVPVAVNDSDLLRTYLLSSARTDARLWLNQQASRSDGSEQKKRQERKGESHMLSKQGEWSGHLSAKNAGNRQGLKRHTTTTQSRSESDGFVRVVIPDGTNKTQRVEQ
jgi:hypothetical protein|tara:strand:- start:87 stop:551 length:465 start_codon:yes stop_codon:yes gene_type:complete